ncbi:hypothetical protein ACI65C_013532 [Semiaphis heraclei]
MGKHCFDLFKNIFFVHCYGHCLNLILVNSVGYKNRIAFDFFGTIQLVYNFIEGSCSRHAIFEQIVNSTNVKLKTLKSLSNTRWACRSEAVSAVKINYSSLLVATEEIIDSTKQSEVRVKGLGIIFQLKKFEFIFALEMFHPILSAVLKVSTFLQTSNINLLTAVEVIDSLKESLKKMRNEEYEFQNIYKNTLKLCTDIDIPIPATKKRKISSKVDTSHTSQYFFKTKEEEIKLTVYNTALDQMINGISIPNLIILQTNDDDICTLATSFNLDTETLQTEIRLLQNYDNVPKNELKNKCDELIKWLTSCDRQNIFPSVLKALKTIYPGLIEPCIYLILCEDLFKLSLGNSHQGDYWGKSGGGIGVWTSLAKLNRIMHITFRPILEFLSDAETGGQKCCVYLIFDRSPQEFTRNCLSNLLYHTINTDDMQLIMFVLRDRRSKVLCVSYFLKEFISNCHRIGPASLLKYSVKISLESLAALLIQFFCLPPISQIPSNWSKSY